MMERLWNIIDESDTDGEDELHEANNRIRRPRWVRERNNYFEDLDETDFVMRFRLSKAAAYELLIRIEDRLEYITDRNQAISPMNQLLTTLRFYGTNNTQLTIADFGGFCTTTAHRVIHKVTKAIASLHNEYIKFPDTVAKIRSNQIDFYNVARFPRVVGAMDCTHIRISSPGGNRPEIFRNRKGYYSINVQTVCNSKMEIIDLVARWPGSAHDSTIFNNSVIKAKFEAGQFGTALLLVDGGYASTSYTMPPLENPQSPTEQLYNEAHIRTRNCVERMYGIWKRRFPVLALGLRIKLNKSLNVIVATAILHNMLLQRREPTPPDDPNLHLPVPWETLLQDGQVASRSSGPHRHRDLLISTYFSNL